VREVAERLFASLAFYPSYETKARATEIIEVSSREYYGDGYQDIMTRVPSIARARRILGWEPKVGMDEAIRRTVDFYLTKRETKS
jgi:nucleoside-diphosphate-sugar epimerase